MSSMYASTDSWRTHNARRVQIHIDTDLPAEPLSSRWSPSIVEPPEITVDPPSASRSSEDSSLWIDRTSLATGVFDPARNSCVFDALDDELLFDPVQCFADVCWADAVSQADSRRASRIRQSEQEEENLRLQPITSTVTGTGIDSRAVHWADDDATIEGASLLSTTLTQVQVSQAQRVIFHEAPAPVFLPFTDKLNIVAPTERLVAEPASPPPPFSAKPPAADPYVHPASHANPRQDPFVLNLNLNHAAHADPSEAIGFFPTPRPRAASSSTSKAKLPGSRFKLFAYFHTPRRI